MKLRWAPSGTVQCLGEIGNEVVAPGTPVGSGLTKSAARDFGLLEGTPVGASLIDAHAGGVGTIGGRGQSGEPVDVCSRLAYIMGTSACIMATTSCRFSAAMAMITSSLLAK